jgi:CBS-domain-containing membrane protein
LIRRFQITLSQYAYLHNILCAGAAALAIAFMVLTKLPHPPAIALAIGIADGQDYLVIKMRFTAGKGRPS